MKKHSGRLFYLQKRYVGNKYEFDLHKYKQTSMGIVTKRRDNAAIVKVVYGGIIDIIMREKNITKSIDFLNKALNRLVRGKYGFETLVISKTLRLLFTRIQIALRTKSWQIVLRPEIQEINLRSMTAYRTFTFVRRVRTCFRATKLKLQSIFKLTI